MYLQMFDQREQKTLQGTGFCPDLSLTTPGTHKKVSVCLLSPPSEHQERGCVDHTSRAWIQGLDGGRHVQGALGQNLLLRRQ